LKQRWLLICAVLLAACRPAPRAMGPLPHEVYVWQRVWTPEVRAGSEQARGSMERVVVLAAQMSVEKVKPVEPAIDFAALKASGKPIGLAIRVEPYFGEFREDDEAIRRIVEVARSRIAAARAAGVEPVELQIDFDCAESKLGGYRTWLRVVREAVKPLPVCPTVLPSWLGRAEFNALARECGSFVLQVHCVAPPRRLADTRRLTDTESARRWVEQAARTGVPFRVALPTYAYLVAFDSAGKPLGVSAEGSSSRWPENAQVVRWEADPAEIAQLVAEWTKSRPAMLRGLIWYRLPIASDTLNWRWPTLAAVMQGRAPASTLRVAASQAQPSEIELTNDGERDERLPLRIEAAWEGARLVAGDALAGYELERPADDAATRAVFVRRSGEELSRLPPGNRRPIGWLRCEPAASIRVTFVPAAPGSDGPSDGH
jgi:hypothetical protein